MEAARHGPLPAFGHPPLVGEGIGDQRGIGGRVALALAPPLLGGEGLGGEVRAPQRFIDYLHSSLQSPMPQPGWRLPMRRVRN